MKEVSIMKLFEDYPEILDAKMVAKIMGIGYQKALDLMKSGELSAKKIRGTYCASKSQFIAWINRPGFSNIDLRKDRDSEGN